MHWRRGEIRTKKNGYIRIGRFHFKAFEKLAVKKEALNPFVLKKKTNLESDIGNITEPALFSFAFFTIWNQNHRGNRSLKFSSVFPISK